MKNIDLKFLGGKDVSFVIKKADELFNENLEGKIHAHKLYNLLLDQIPNIYEKKKERIFRGHLRQKIWNCEKTFFWNEKYASQAGQDKLIKDYFFRKEKSGYFVDIGAYDGVMGSNSLHFERFLKWDGIAIEPSKLQFEKLKKNRGCKVINKAIGSTAKEVEFMDVIEGLTQMSGIKNEIYLKHNSNIISKDHASQTKTIKITTTTFSEIVPSDIEIDYLSIDIEGSEFELLESIDFDKYKIKVLSVENNLPDDQDFQFFLNKKKFKYFDRVGQDEIFFNNNLFKID